MAEAPKYFTPEEVVERLRGSVKMRTLMNWRSKEIGPAWVKCGTKVLYPVNCFEDWEQKMIHQPGAGRK